jgi:hypothetical protein
VITVPETNVPASDDGGQRKVGIKKKRYAKQQRLRFIALPPVFLESFVYTFICRCPHLALWSV